MAEKDHNGFYAYTHARPDGSVFYVGKGRGRRAWDYAKSRRSLHHWNIIQKYGIAAIIVAVHPTETESEAFALERKMIAETIGLINLTGGGEGCSGREMTPLVTLALANGRRKWSERGLSDGAIDRMTAKSGQVTPAKAAWYASLRFMTHAASSVDRMMEARLRQPPKQRECTHCGASFLTRSQRQVRWCSKACGQRGRVAELRNEHRNTGLLPVSV